MFAKDVILTIIRRLGVQGGVGYAYEYGGSALDRMSMDERMTICNMSIEGGARAGYVNPDDTTFALPARAGGSSPKGDAFDRAVTWWRADGVGRERVLRRPRHARRGVHRADGHLGHQPRPVRGRHRVDSRRRRRGSARLHGIHGEGAASAGTKIDVAFIGSCTNGRLSDIEEAARIVRGHHVSPHVKALIVPGSRAVAREAEKRGLHQMFIDAGFEWRGAGCSMCLAMNPDKLEGRQVCASSSNRNFKGRQGSPTGRTLLMSPAMVAAAAIAGEVVDVRTMLEAVPA